MSKDTASITGDIRAILFDLGNVLIDIDFDRCARYWSDRAGIPAKSLAARFRIDDAYRDFECGRIEAPDYYASLRRQLGITLSDDTLREGWNTIIRNERAGIRACIGKLAGRYPLFILSNTNSEHEVVWRNRHRDLLAFFDNIFVSSRMGCRKPDSETYHKVASAIGQPCSRILFFDDTEENVCAAQKCGMHAVHVATADTIARTVAPLLDEPGG